MTKKASSKLRLESLERRQMLTASPELISPQSIGDFDFNEGFMSQPPIISEVVNGAILLTPPGRGDDTETSLWKIDGTQIQRIDAFSGIGRPSRRSTLFNGEFYFEITLEPERQSEIWKTDGTEEGTMRISDKHTDRLDDFIEYKGGLYFSSGNDLWVTDGTQTGTNPVMNFGSNSSITNLSVLHDSILMTVLQPSRQTELWISDGLIRDRERIAVIPDFQLNLARGGTRDASQRFFTGQNGLWRTDGTASGTFLLSERITNSYANAVVAGNKIFFEGTSDEAGTELWASDGTINGTYLVKDINVGPRACGMSRLMAVADEVYFNAQDESGANGLWKSDGTEENTLLVKEVVARPILAVNDELYFAGNDGLTGSELWKTDGTTDGTLQIVDLNRGSDWSIGKHRYASVVDDMLYFVGYDGVTGIGLWGIQMESHASVDRLIGDVNLGGVFDSSDLVRVFQAGQYQSDNSANANRATFAQGDWNGDGIFDSSDLVATFRIGSYHHFARMSKASTNRIYVDRFFASEEIRQWKLGSDFDF